MDNYISPCGDMCVYAYICVCFIIEIHHNIWRVYGDPWNTTISFNCSIWLHSFWREPWHFSPFLKSYNEIDNWLDRFSKKFFRARNSYKIVVILFWPNQCCWNGSPFCFNKAEQYPVLDETDKFRLFSVKLILLLVFQHWGFFSSSDLRKGSFAVKDRNIRHSFSVFMLCNLLSVWPLTSHLISLWFNFLPLKADIMLTFTHPLCFSFNLLAVQVGAIS